MMRISLIVLSILTSCFKDETVSGQTNDEAIWLLSTMNEAPITTHITIAFPEEGKIAGQAPCNRYFGSQTAPLPWFEIKGLGATKMACPELELETQYFTMLQKMTTAEITGNTLILATDTGSILVFNKK
jgi:heat shock protein HslJ